MGDIGMLGGGTVLIHNGDDDATWFGVQLACGLGTSPSMEP